MSKLKMETDYMENKAETVFHYVEDKTVEPRMTTSGICEFVKLFQWAKSAISSQCSGRTGPRGNELQREVLKLEEGLQGLRDTLPKMYVLLDRAEWSSHKDYVVELLPNLKDGVYDAEDLLDEFKWYELQVTVEGNANQCPFSDFFNNVITGSFNEKVQCIQDRLDNLSNQLEKMGLHEVKQSFDKSVRPETTYLLNDTKIFGRDMELEQVIGLLSKPENNRAAQSKHKWANKDCYVPSLHVLPIVGIGGVGKTTLAQHVYNHKEMGNHFNLKFWICVSDDFDVMRMTKEALESCSGERPTSDNLDTLQHALSEHVNDKKVLIILDDLWGDALEENGKYWNVFCASLTNTRQGSLVLVTTRSPMVADAVCTMNPFTLHGLEEDAFWNFFKLCIFESDSSNIDPCLEYIGESILTKLKGNPLAAKSVGLLLRMDLRASHWNYVSESELWELKQEKTDILPSLQLSYMYLPLHLKRCFAFCAVYPKDYRFQKHGLAEIWVAEGFVDPEGDTPATDIGCQYFEELVNESFFEKASGEAYIIPHLMHDMAKLVSRNDCFTIREKKDFGKVPRDVRHLSIKIVHPSILSRGDFNHAKLSSLCKHTKLRTLLCSEVLGTRDISAVMDLWCRGFHCLRVMSCDSTKELPDSIGNLKHLRYLEISNACPLNSLPSAFCYLYSLQFVYVRKCKLVSLAGDFSKLISLRRFDSDGFVYNAGCDLTIDAAGRYGLGIGLIKNLSDLKVLCIYNLGMISKNNAAEVELKNKRRLDSLKLECSMDRSSHLDLNFWYKSKEEIIKERDNDKQVLQVLEPPTSLKSLLLWGYRGVSLPSWFGPENLPSLASLSRISQRIDLNEMPVELLVDSNKETIGIFPLLTELEIFGCQNLYSLEQLVQPVYIPVIKRIAITDCESLVSAGSFVGFRCLEELVVDKCPNIYSRSLVAPSLKTLKLGHWTSPDGIKCGNLADNIECCSLTSFKLSCDGLTSIQLQNWNLPALRELDISFCQSLTTIGQNGPIFPNLSVCRGTGSSIRGAFPSLTCLIIRSCDELSTIDNLLSEEYLPVIEKIELTGCKKLLSLPVEIGSLASLHSLNIIQCPSIRWPSGLVFPSSLERLYLNDSGDMSACVPSCLENLTSLVSMRLEACPGITVVPGEVWSSSLKSLEQLLIEECPDLVSIGGSRAIAKVPVVIIHDCPKLQDMEQPHRRGHFEKEN